jgi:ketosteroid isomerase-like protein
MTLDQVTMPTTPEALMTAFAGFVQANDLDGLVGLYAADAVFQPSPGVELRGNDIRSALAELLTLRPVITYRGDTDVVVCGDLALVSNDWTMSGEAPDGSAVREGGLSADVVRRRSDGSWEVLIDQPRGKPC